MLLSAPLPLRTTNAWQGYHQTAPIQIALGRCTLAPIPYDIDRRVWVVSDQPIMGITAARFGATAISSWIWRNTTDSTAHASAQIEFAEPVPDDITPSLDVLGLPHPLTGALMENPADITWWILTTMAERTLDYRTFDDARTVLANAGLWVGGVLADKTLTIRATITEILDSVGATWALNIPGIIRLYPEAVGTSTQICSDITDFEAVANFGDLANDITIAYQRDWAAGDTLLAVSAESTDSQDIYGRISLTLDAPWLRDTAAATRLAQRCLEYRKSPVWRYTWKSKLAMQPGTWVTVNHAYAPVALAIILGCDYDLARNETVVLAEAHA